MIGIICIVIYAAAVSKFGITVAIGLLVAFAALLGGGLLGFLFAIPRNPAPVSAENGTTTHAYRSNSNLEEISDWLTKILVGLGLVQFNKIIDASSSVVDSIAHALGNQASSASFAAAVLVVFGVSGFLGVYILTRVYLGPVFALSEEEMKTLKKTIDSKVDEKVQEKVAEVELKLDEKVEEKVAEAEARR